jgi:hypothetical protein
MTRAITPPFLYRATWAEFADVPGCVLVPAARKALGLAPDELADVLGVDKQTVWRWERDPVKFGKTSRALPPTARRVLFWMLRPGRPDAWPDAPKKGTAS